MLTTQQTKPASDSDDNSSCEVVNYTEEVISVSSDSEKLDENAEKCLISYCSICKMKNSYTHDCFKYNNEFCTCLVPNCNILAKSFNDITPHLRQHMGMPSGAVLCHRCFQENKISERDVDGYHSVCRHMKNLFKCYTCNKIFESMAEFATHKLKQHKGQLRDNNGNYLCLYCEISSSDMMMIVEHQKYCREFQNKKEESLKKKLLSDDEKTKRVIRKVQNAKLPHSSKHFLFTCLKPSCKFIFQNFSTFKSHHREHFGYGNDLMCWQCCTPFLNLNCLRLHQVKGNCRTPEMFKCHECPLNYDDLQSLSIHKYTMHDGKLLIAKKGKKTILCAFCKTEIKIINLRNHLINCKLNKNKTITYKPQLPLMRGNYFHKCSFCGKKCLTAAALTSHKRIHNVYSKNEQQLGRIGFNTETNDEMNRTSSSISQMNTRAFRGTDEEMVPTSSNSFQNDPESKPDFDTFPYIDGLYSCIQCPKKYRSIKGLSMHWPFCSNRVSQNSQQNSRTNLAQNYYCTKCEEYYTRVSFGHHWKINHGSRLPFKRNKRFCCTKCPYKFLYKIALVMHVEHAHSELKTLDNNVVTFPIVSETTSLAKANEDNCGEQVLCEENAGTSGIQGNNDEELEIKIDCNTNENSNKEPDKSYDNMDYGVIHNAQIVNHVNDNEMEMLENITNEDAMEVIDSTYEMENNDEVADNEKYIKKEFTAVDDDDNDNNEEIITSVEVDSFDCMDNKVETTETLMNYK